MLVFRWWYGAGWQWAWQRSVSERLDWCIKTFSLPELIRTWFSPFKQTYNHSGGKGTIDMKINAMIDNLVSRVIGTIARSCLILAGLVCMMLAAITGVLFVIIWPMIPLLPVIALGLSALGVGV